MPKHFFKLFGISLGVCLPVLLPLNKDKLIKQKACRWFSYCRKFTSKSCFS